MDDICIVISLFIYLLLLYVNMLLHVFVCVGLFSGKCVPVYMYLFPWSSVFELILLDLYMHENVYVTQMQRLLILKYI
uniref:Uncharacterized protein n=1 Tax=Octopus bimaculoides TaxID=37653 RepID=A0A0L8IEE9_OCTBM